MAVNGKHLLEKRRQREDACRDMDNRVLDDRKAQQQSLFESSSALKIDHKMRQERMKELRSANERGLEIRRQQLADLYNDEMEGWRSEVMARVETHEDRKARYVKNLFNQSSYRSPQILIILKFRIYERAYALRDARENERRKTVDQKYHEQWRESCDEVRTLDSRALTIHMVKYYSLCRHHSAVIKYQLTIDSTDISFRLC